MKFLIYVTILITISVVSANPPKVPDFATVKAECITESGVTDEVLEQLYNFDLIENHAGKCFAKCICSRVGSCVPDLKMNAEVILKIRSHFPADKIREAAPICNEIKHDDDCETAYSRFRCMLERVPEFKDMRTPQ